MRIRTVLAAAVAVAFVVLTPAAALAAPDGDDISHIGHCVEEAVHAGQDPERCLEAPNPILPEPVEIIWGSASFLVLLVAMWKFALPAVQKGMVGRTERIRSDLVAAETAKTEAETVLTDYKAKLADARAESARIIEEARQTADGLKRDLQARAEADIAELRQRAAADVESARSQAIADLRSEVAVLALDAAEMVVQKNLDRPTQIELIENYINQVGSRN